MRIKLGLLWLILISAFCLIYGCSPVSQQPVLPETETGEAVELETVEPDVASRAAHPQQVEVVEANSIDVEIAVDAACELIYQGRFAEASEFIEQTQPLPVSLTRLAAIVTEYNDISVHRQLAKQEEYAKQLAKFNQYKIGEANDINDINDVNSIPKVLSVIVGVHEFADEEQAEQLLSDSFVQQTIQRAIDNADSLEERGKWLDAYVMCYTWLTAIDEDNKAYSEYSEELITKAGILASFQDSPCETREQRYENIEKRLLVKAIRALNFSYVNIIDYQEMAVKSIERCGLLTDVLGNSYVELDTEYEIEDTQITAWLNALERLKAEVNNSPTGISRDGFIDIFDKTLEINDQTVKLPVEVLIAQFTEAGFASLDPYTVMVWPRQKQDFERIITNEFTGIGIEISNRKGSLTVVSLLPDTPAYNSGLDAGDVIERIDGVETRGMSLICAVKTITGRKGTDVTLTVRAPGQDSSREITITRATITVPTIRGWQRTEAGKWLYMIDDGSKIGYVRITSFADKTANDFEKVLGSLEKDGMKGLILDLRFNSGGLLTSAVEMTDKFIKKGVIVTTRPRFGVPTYATAHKTGTHPDYPIVILINSGSASASEIMAGALADAKHERVILVGRRTHGKGSVQTITNYPGHGAQLKYTMAYYHLPSGQRVESRDAMEKQGEENWGVAPDIEVELRSDELRRMIDIQRDNDVLVKADHDNGTDPLKKYTIKDTLAADAQLAVGVLVIKSKLIQAVASEMTLN